MEPLVVSDRRDGVVTVRLNRPPFNVFDDGMVTELRTAIRTCADDTSVGALVITGSERAFAAGADLKQLVDFDFEQIVAWNRSLERTFAEVSQLPFPVIAAVNGPALGGGFELALAADFCILGEKAKLGLPEVHLGIVPGAGGMQRLQKAVGSMRAKELIMTGRRLTATDALSLGLALDVVGVEDCLGAAHELATALADGPRHAISAIKQAIDIGSNSSLESGLALDRSLLAGVFSTRDRHRGMMSFLKNGPGHAKFGDIDASA